MSLLNIGLSNLALNLDSDTPRFLTDEVLSGCGSMKSVREAIAQYDLEVQAAIEVLGRRPNGKPTADDNGDDGDEEIDNDGEEEIDIDDDEEIDIDGDEEIDIADNDGEIDIDGDKEIDKLNIGLEIMKFFPK
jgi:hypothetical protein